MIPIFTKLVEYYLYYTPNPCLLMLASSTAIGRLATEPALRTKIFVSTLKVDLSLDDPSATVRGVMMAPLVCNDDDRQFQIFALEIFLQRPVRQRYYAESSVPSPQPVLNPDLIPPYRKPKNARTKRIFEKRSPKLIENPKQAILVRGSTASAQTQSILADLVYSPSNSLTTSSY
jgi:hypothetical protein